MSTGNQEKGRGLKEKARAMQLRNARVMSPVTGATFIAIVLYLTFVFNGLQPPDAPYNFGLIVKFFFCFIAVGGPSIFIFEFWFHRQILTIARVLVWDGDPDSMPEREVISALATLIDLPHRFIIRLILHWVLVAPLIVLALKIFFLDLPMINVILLSMGLTSIFCLMSTLQYLQINRVYDEYLNEAIEKHPTFFERPELAVSRFGHQNKIIPIVLIAGSVTLTALLSLAGQIRFATLERDRAVKEVMQSDNMRYLVDGIKNYPDNRDLILAVLPSELTGKIDLKGKAGDRSKVQLSIYLFTPDNFELLHTDSVENWDPMHVKLLQLIPRTDDPPPGWFSEKLWRETAWEVFTKNYWKNFFHGELVIRITPRVMIAYAGGRQYTITFLPVRRGKGDEPVAYFYRFQTEENMAYRVWGQFIGPVMIVLLLVLPISLVSLPSRRSPGFS